MISRMERMVSEDRFRRPDLGPFRAMLQQTEAKDTMLFFVAPQ
jgi:hypothetical protein